MDSRADVAVRVRSVVVAVEVEQTVVLIVVVATTHIQHNPGRVIVAAVVTKVATRLLARCPEYNLFKILDRGTN